MATPYSTATGPTGNGRSLAYPASMRRLGCRSQPDRAEGMAIRSGGRDVAMAEELLERPHIIAVFENCVARNGGRYAACLAIRACHTASMTLVERPTTRADGGAA